ncbi:TM1802 family CRISPR-associated protein [Desulfallas thermosapovorans]|uniref:CRISPR-associated protein Csh1 n=1 Tax=Desulfallas thermosapovorans DSM 6562 TaxID=1121431 RepID=A0A5S4ZMP8_9FIRM|nr:TM1802 family CRISPR-associated protein [Desulfallas thermosapovorans]TYO92773.1 CRISPR-associated protein Csh1 [Desulfallas thermosapovorans DSM 6562]
MGFLSAVRALGELSSSSGWEAYLKFPLDEPSAKQKSKAKNKVNPNDGHKVIRIWLQVGNPAAGQLDVQGVEKIDLVDYQTGPEMKLKYLYRDKVGANTFWGFTPVFKMGKPKKDLAAKKAALLGESGNWRQEDKSIYYKLKHRLLGDYETCEIFSPGAVDKIMNDLSDQVDRVLEFFEGKGSFIMVFGIGTQGQFLYPGQIPAFVNYFKDKLEQYVQKKSSDRGQAKNCFCCGKIDTEPATLDKVFKFATFDKVNVLPGLNKDNVLKVQPVCQECLQLLTAGREILERELADKSIISGIVVWLVPEVALPGQSKKFLRQAIDKLNVDGKGATGMGEEAERRFFHKLTRYNDSLSFHFLFWEKQNAQERVHLMVEDVPPSRLARLEKAWGQALANLGLEWESSLDNAVTTVYSTCMALSGQSNEDKTVMRDFVIRLIGKMLKGERLPADSFKAIFVRRIPKMVFDSDKWSNVSSAARKAQLVVEFMEQINREVR